MDLIKLLRREIKEPLHSFLYFIIINGIASALLVNLINRAAENVFNKTVNYEYFFLFVLCVGIICLTRKHVFRKSFRLIDTVVHQIRERVGNKLRNTELSTLEEVGKPPIYAMLTQDIMYISNSSWKLITFIQSCVILIFMLIYIVTVSVPAFIIVLVGLGISFINLALIVNTLLNYFIKLFEKETFFFKKLGNLLEGFKQIKINRRKSEGVFKEYVKISTERTNTRIKAFTYYDIYYSNHLIVLYIMIAFIIFTLPQYQETYSETIMKLAAALLFMLGPIENILNTIVSIGFAENAASNILGLEKKLDKALETQKRKFTKSATSKQVVPFERTICLENIIYQYNNKKQAFSIGPITTNFQKGEIIFITGGNGSGKSTFLKMLTGLYVPKKGNIYIDRDIENGIPGTKITAGNYNEYMELFSILFLDFYLFDKLYAAKINNPDKINRLLYRMGLPLEKTAYNNGGFTNIELSSGQRKRLALVTCILEDKEVYIFDEVASDLDPEFRDTYYYELLPELKARNKTVFVVSHDKSYWEVGDRVLKLKNGQVYEVPSSMVE